MRTAQRASWLAALFLLLLMASAGVAQAQEAAPAGQTGAVTPNQVNEVAKQIWCPLCSGVRLDSCELKACDQMKEVIALKLAEGEDAKSIKAYFLDQYGPEILGEPPRQGFNWLAWILPFVALIGGGIFLWTQARGMVRPRAAGQAEAEAQPAQDEYARKLEEELKQYG